jgi:hypothetical protein
LDDRKRVNVKGGHVARAGERTSAYKHMERDQYGRSRSRCEYKINQDRQCAINLTQMRISETTVAVKEE